MKEQNATSAKHSSPWPLFALAYVLTWIFWIPLAVSGQDAKGGPLIILVLLGGVGPSIAGIIMTYRTQDREGRRDFWRRSISFKQISLGWYAVILLIFPAAYGLGILLDILLGGSLPGAEVLVQAAAQPASLIVVLVMTLVMGPLAEEFGWRGFGLDSLQSRWNALASSLVLGFFWWLWHLPLFFIVGMMQNEWGFGSLPFWTYAAQVFAMTVLFTWVYNNTRRSVLAAILLHFMINATTGILQPISDRGHLFTITLLVVAAVAVVIAWGAETLPRQQE